MIPRSLRSLLLRLLGIGFIVVLVSQILNPTRTSWAVKKPHPGQHLATTARHWTLSGKIADEGATNFTKPENLSVVALIFAGRPATVSILDCYLKRNLVVNGGILDEVIFLARTKNRQHLAWLNALVAMEPAYTLRNISFNDTGTRKDYRSAWKNLRNDAMYIKIDDDIVFFEDSTIPSLVQTRLQHPEYFIISANLVNQPSLSWVHRSLDIVKPYLPELSAPPYLHNKSEGTGIQRIVMNDTEILIRGNYTQSWRASTLPYWNGSSKFTVGDRYQPPYSGHRWLPVPRYIVTNRTIDDTPISATTFDPFGPGLWRWTIAAQQHYTFFEYLENNELWKYKQFKVWDYQFARMGIQFVAMMGRDINSGLKGMDLDDEHWFSEVMTKRTRRHGVIDGRAVAAHYSFGPQRDGMAATDVLDRYRAFANEKICVPYG